MVSQFASTVLARTRRRIELFEQAGDDWRFAESLKSISEDTAQEYEGRTVLELVQNGHDALDTDVAGQIAVMLDVRSSPGTLYVANQGLPFTDTNFNAITELALSDKGAGEGIGNKGVGFRSVLQLTDWPEIYSKSAPSSNTFDGYCFRFATPDDVRQLVHDSELADEVIKKVSPLALPVAADLGDPVLAEFARLGFVTVVRLPLRNEHAAEAARDQIEKIRSSEAPILLFLDRIACLDTEVRADGQGDRRRLTRMSEPSDLVKPLDNDWVSEVELSDSGRYLHARRVLDRRDLHTAIERSIEDREIDVRWREWEDAAWVGVALRLDDDLASGKLYTFLPMSASATAPLHAHAHAPFFTTLARGNFSSNVALNDFLLDEIAA